MGKISEAFGQAFRDFTVSGVPSSGIHAPKKSDIRNIGPAIEAVVSNAATSFLQLGTWAQLQVITGRQIGQAARVLGADNGTHIDPISGKKVKNIGEYAWVKSGLNAGWQWISDLSIHNIDVSKQVRALALRQTKLALSGKIVVDKRGFFDGPAVYIPGKVFLGDTVKLTEFYTELEPLHEKLPAHYKVAIPASFAHAIWIYFDALDRSVQIAVWPERMPADLNRYHHIMTLYSDREGVTTEFDFVSTLDTTDSSFYLNAPASFEAETMTLYIPRIYGWTADGGWSLLPENGESYRRIALPHDSEISFVFLDIAEILANGDSTQKALRITSGYSTKDNPRPARNSFRLALLGIVKNRIFTATHPDFRMVTPVKNLFAMGRDDNDLADNIYSASSPTDLSLAESKALGFLRGYHSSRGRPFYGGIFPEPRNSGCIFMRFYVESDEKNMFPSPSIYMQGKTADGTSINRSFGAYLAKKHSDHLHEYECFVTLADGQTYHSAWAGCYGESDIAYKLRVFGVQIYVGADDYAWISHNDYPKATDEIGARLRLLEKTGPKTGGAFEPYLPTQLFFHPERPYKFYPDQMFSDTGRNQYDLCITSDKGGYEPPYSLELRANSFSISPLQTGSQIRFMFSDFLGNRDEKTVFNVNAKTLDKAAIAAINAKILIIGDSLNDYNGAGVQALQRLRNMGAKLKTLGTITMKSDIAGDPTSELSEARSGRKFSDFIYLITERNSPIEDTKAAWADYLKLGRTKRRDFNPFLKLADADDKKNCPEMIFNDYIFDMRFYLKRSVQPDPDLVDINLHTNDITHFDEATASEHIKKGLHVIINQTRKALPDAKLCIHYNASGRFSDEERWSGSHWKGLKSVMHFLWNFNDANTFLIPNYCTINRDTGFKYTEEKNEAGRTFYKLNDGIHYDHCGLNEYGEVTAQFWAGALTT